MDFIEQIFGIAPDGGDGSLEFLLFAIPIAGLCWLAWRRRAKRLERRRDDA
jgi:hypothetical protein